MTVDRVPETGVLSEIAFLNRVTERAIERRNAARAGFGLGGFRLQLLERLLVALFGPPVSWGGDECTDAAWFVIPWVRTEVPETAKINIRTAYMKPFNESETPSNDLQEWSVRHWRTSGAPKRISGQRNRT